MKQSRHSSDVSTLNTNLIQQQEQMREQKENLRYRVEELVSRKKGKMKLGFATKEKLFDSKFADFKKLPTFVDIHKQIQAMNIIGDPLYLIQVRNKRNSLISQLDLERDLKHREGKRQHQQLEIFTQTQTPTNSQSPTFKKQQIQLIQDHQTQIDRNKLIIQTNTFQLGSDLIKKSKMKLRDSSLMRSERDSRQQFEKIIINQLTDDKVFQVEQNANHNEGLEFYTHMVSDYDKNHAFNTKKQVHLSQKPLDINLQLKELDDFLNTNGIELKSKQIFTNQKYYRNYGNRAKQMIRNSLFLSKQASQMKTNNIDTAEQELITQTQFLIQSNKQLFTKKRKSYSLYNTKKQITSVSQQLAIPDRIIELPFVRGSILCPLPTPVIDKKIRLLKRQSCMQLRKQTTIISVKDVANSQMNSLTSRIQRTQSEFHKSQPDAFRQLESMKQEIERTSDKYIPKYTNTLEIDPQQISEYVKMTQRLFKTDLFQKKKEVIKYIV